MRPLRLLLVLLVISSAPAAAQNEADPTPRACEIKSDESWSAWGRVLVLPVSNTYDKQDILTEWLTYQLRKTTGWTIPSPYRTERAASHLGLDYRPDLAADELVRLARELTADGVIRVELTKDLSNLWNPHVTARLSYLRAADASTVGICEGQKKIWNLFQHEHYGDEAIEEAIRSFEAERQKRRKKDADHG